MAVAVVFLLGIANFAMHRAVLESGHRLVGMMAGGRQLGWAPRVTLAMEFTALLASLLLVARGHTGWAWAYGAYSCANGFAAWLILTRRI